MENNILIFIITQAIILLATIVGVYLNIQLKLKELDLRVASIEKQDNLISQQLTAISNQIIDLRIAMENKTDRS